MSQEPLTYTQPVDSVELYEHSNNDESSIIHHPSSTTIHHPPLNNRRQRIINVPLVLTISLKGIDLFSRNRR